MRNVERILRGISGIRHPTALRQIHKVRKGGACSTSWRDVKCIQNCGRNTWRYYMGCGDENCKIALNRIGARGFRRDSFGSARFRAAGACEDRTWNVMYHRTRETSWLCLIDLPLCFSRTTLLHGAMLILIQKFFVTPDGSRPQYGEKGITNIGRSSNTCCINTDPTKNYQHGLIFRHVFH